MPGILPLQHTACPFSVEEAERWPLPSRSSDQSPVTRLMTVQLGWRELQDRHLPACPGEPRASPCRCARGPLVASLLGWSEAAGSSASPCPALGCECGAWAGRPPVWFAVLLFCRQRTVMKDRMREARARDGTWQWFPTVSGGEDQCRVRAAGGGSQHTQRLDPQGWGGQDGAGPS